ncbi:hypothetical protein ACSAZL_06130 [Methanosarcina sp. T3]|uniref:hypothetical protein n=1 Tax=Methanosarcina sp. T3 TaxID=3439062 RepID=UPI003F865829
MRCSSKKFGVYGFYVDSRVSGNFRSDPAFAYSFFEDLDLLFIRINKLFLHGFSCSKGRVKSGRKMDYLNECGKLVCWITIMKKG